MRYIAPVLTLILILVFLSSCSTENITGGTIVKCNSRPELGNVDCFKFGNIISETGLYKWCYYNLESPRKYYVCNEGWSPLPDGTSPHIPDTDSCIGDYLCYSDGTCRSHGNLNCPLVDKENAK